MKSISQIMNEFDLDDLESGPNFNANKKIQLMRDVVPAAGAATIVGLLTHRSRAKQKKKLSKAKK